MPSDRSDDIAKLTEVVETAETLVSLTSSGVLRILLTTANSERGLCCQSELMKAVPSSTSAPSPHKLGWSSTARCACLCSFSAA